MVKRLKLVLKSELLQFCNSFFLKNSLIYLTKMIKNSIIRLNLQIKGGYFFMGNNLSKVEKNLRSIAKRYKSVKYSLGLAILFLMMGVSAFSEEVNEQVAGIPTMEEIASSKNSLRSSVGNLQSKINEARAENQKTLKGLRLELIQLMEQGNQVVKSPWASWNLELIICIINGMVHIKVKETKLKNIFLMEYIQEEIGKLEMQ